MSNAPTLPDNMQVMTDLVLTLQQKLDHQSFFIEQLLEQIKLAKHHRFRIKSEAISSDQLRLLLDEMDLSFDMIGINGTSGSPRNTFKVLRRVWTYFSVFANGLFGNKFGFSS